MSFYYFRDWWINLVDNLYQEIQNSTKRTHKNKKDKELEEDKQLLIYNSNAPQSWFWKGIYLVFKKLIQCPFCQGCWAGYLVYLLLVINWTNLTLNIHQVIEFAFFSWSCGIISRLTTPTIDSL